MGRRGTPHLAPLQSRTIFIYIKEKFQKEKRKAHCRYLINFDRFYPGLLFERREPTLRRWGGYDPPTRSVTRHRGKTEVNSNVARRTLRKDDEKRWSTDKKKNHQWVEKLSGSKLVVSKGIVNRRISIRRARIP